MVFDTASVGIGWITPDDPMASTRPQPALRIAGSRRSVVSATRSTIWLNCAVSFERSASTILPGGGPPVLATRISAEPIVSATARASVSAASSRARSQPTHCARP